jgi:hypothetical protein
MSLTTNTNTRISALQTQLLDQDLTESFMSEYVSETNIQRAGASQKAETIKLVHHRSGSVSNTL